MTRAIHKLTTKQIAAFGKRRGLFSDGGCLYIRSDGENRLSWQFIFKSPTTGTQRAMGLGSAAPGGRPLGEARDLAAAARALLRAGRDPIEERENERKLSKPKAVKTFGACADLYVETHAGSWRNRKHESQWRYSLTTHCAAIRETPVDAIDTEAVLSVLRPIWDLYPETATRVRSRIELVLDAARTQGLRTGENAARWKGHLQHLLARPKKLVRGHLASMPYNDVPKLMTRLSADTSILAKLLRLTILCASRSGEMRNLRWSEVDLEKRLIVIPPARMKGHKEHRIPLTDAALEILRERLPFKGDGDLVFPSRRKAFSDMAAPKLLRRLGHADITLHGFRSSFRMWAAEQTSTPHEVIEMALAHNTLSAVERAYQRSDLADRRRALMDAWARHCAGGSNVVQLATSAA
jgi:integrase